MAKNLVCLITLFLPTLMLSCAIFSTFSGISSLVKPGVGFNLSLVQFQSTGKSGSAKKSDCVLTVEELEEMW